jgi:hypothetical protein
MSVIDTAFSEGVADALQIFTKLSAQKARTVARGMAANGDIAGASRIMSAPGVVSPTSSGVPFHNLGAGSEGLAQLAMHPASNPNQPVVKKIFDQTARGYSPTLIQRKAEIGPELNKSPAFAQFHGASTTPTGAPVHYNEYVHGTGGTDADKGTTEFKHVKRQAEAAGEATGHQLTDIAPRNMRTQPDGSMKVIDHMPFKENEIASKSDRHALENAGVDLPTPMTDERKLRQVFPNADKHDMNLTPHEIQRQAYGGVAPKPRPPPAATPEAPQAAQAMAQHGEFDPHAPDPFASPITKPTAPAPQQTPITKPTGPAPVNNATPITRPAAPPMQNMATPITKPAAPPPMNMATPITRPAGMPLPGIRR